MPYEDRQWVPDVLITTTAPFDHKFWWVDLSWGLLHCDPLAEEPVLLIHALPPGCTLDTHPPEIRERRCLCESGGHLVFAEITGGGGGEAMVSLWTGKHAIGYARRPVSEPDLEGTLWAKDYEMSFSEIWNDDTYKGLLPRKVPAIVFIHPRHGHVIFFFVAPYVFSVDVFLHRVEQVVEDACKVPRSLISSYILPWEVHRDILMGFAAAASRQDDEGGRLDRV